MTQDTVMWNAGDALFVDTKNMDPAKQRLEAKGVQAQRSGGASLSDDGRQLRFDSARSSGGERKNSLYK